MTDRMALVDEEVNTVADVALAVIAEREAAAAAYRDRVRLEGYNEAVAVMLKERERWAILERNLRNLRNEPAGALDQESRFDPRPGLDASADVAERNKLGLDHGISILTCALAARSPATPGEKP